MKRAGIYVRITALLFAFTFVCATSWGGGKQDGLAAGISARGAIGRLDALSGPLWTGDGGKDLRLAVLAPEAKEGAPGYLPMYIQGLLNSNLKRHSAMTLIDRQNLDRIIAEQKLSASGLYSDKDLVNIGKLTNAQYLLAGSLQKLSGSVYALQLAVTEASTGEQKAAFTGKGSLAQIEGSGSLINQASEELLAQLGVNLTEAGRLSLSGGNTFMARAENAYAKGVAAQATGDQLEALFSYAQAASFDPGQLEALARLGSLSSTISGGSISERIINDFQARDRWLEVFKETARFYNEHPPFELIFDPSLEQEGESDYVKRTVTLRMWVGLVPSEAGFAALNALLEGLEQTGRREPWGFTGWPMEDLKPAVNGTVLFTGKDATSFTLEVLLLNDKQKEVGRGSVTLNAGQLAAPGNKSVTLPKGRFDTIRFRDIKADKLSPVLTIVISSVNGIPSKTLNSTGYMRIAPEDVVTAERAANQGKAYYEHHEYDRAVERYTKALALDPANPFYQENLEKAQAAAEQAAAERRAAAVLANKRGDEYYDKKNYRRAMDEYSEAIGLDPNNAVYYNSRGAAYLNSGDNNRAVTDFAEAARLNPNSARYKENLEKAKAAVAAEERVKAERAASEKAAAEKAAAVERRAAEARAEAERKAAEARAAAERRAAEQAAAAARAAEERKAAEQAAANKAAAERAFKRGNEYYTSKGYDQAVKEYTEAIGLDPNNAVYYNSRGAAYLNSSDNNRAVTDFAEAAILNPNNARYKENLEKAQAAVAAEERAKAERAAAEKAAERRALEQVHMVRIPGGTFTMGSPANEPGRDNDEVQHQVTVSAFSMGNYEVTQQEWREVMGNNPSNFKGDSLPVEQVSWYEAVEYCNRRSRREGLNPAYTIHGTNVSWNRNANGYRLPTEAEWEYACRAGTSDPFNTGYNISTGQANYNGNYPYHNNAKGAYRGKTVSVGSFAANAWGLYDMHGNVWEWCWDWYGNYPSRAQTDPTGPSTGADRVNRGGSWNHHARYLRSANRNYSGPSSQYNYLGFRLARNAE
jgi:formylglycine-generating enzyme required for sulfatase activity